MKKMNSKHITVLCKIAIVLDVLATIYAIACICWTFELTGEFFSQKLTRFFVIANPMTIGAYSIGIVAAVNCKAFNNVISIVAVCTVYVLMILASLVAIMGMDGWTDVILFLLPHIIIIGYIVIILIKKLKPKKNSSIINARL